MNKKVIIIGASGHGKVIADIVLKSNDILVGFLDDGKEKGMKVFDNYEVLGDITYAQEYQDCEFIIGIGNNSIRKRIAESYDLKWYTAIHPTASIGIDVDIQEGTVVMAYAVINSSAKIKKHCIINTGAIIEHDNYIEDYVHVSPNATLCGTVYVGKSTHVGASATIKNNIKVAGSCIIGTGAVVVKDILEEGTYVGIPAKKIVK